MSLCPDDCEYDEFPLFPLFDGESVQTVKQGTGTCSLWSNGSTEIHWLGYNAQQASGQHKLIDAGWDVWFSRNVVRSDAKPTIEPVLLVYGINFAGMS